MAFLLWFMMILAPCGNEDAANCTWYASLQGNGEGRSFVNVMGEVYYLD